jgi:SAM-dependent methyltransferase
MPVSNPLQRFSSRVADYIRYRPGYPLEVLELLKRRCGLTSDSIVADVASGTGIFTRMLLENGNRVFAVEPNADMRAAAELALHRNTNFVSIDGAAEETTLPGQGVDFVTAAQAAHWFNREKARREFARILKPTGWTVLIWNERSTDATPFLREYEELLMTYGSDYQDVRHERATKAIHEFFALSPFEQSSFENVQEFDFATLMGRLLSSSYTPQPGDPKHEPMLKELKGIFERHQKGGIVRFEYETRVYYGRLK